MATLARVPVTSVFGLPLAPLEGACTCERIPGIPAGIVYDQTLIWNQGYGWRRML